LLHQLLRRSGEVVDSGIDQIRSTVDDLVRNSLGRLKQLVQSPRAQELDELRTQLRELEQRISILLDHLDEQSEETTPSRSRDSSDSRPAARATDAS
jgi:archaellum component FlaC